MGRASAKASTRGGALVCSVYGVSRTLVCRRRGNRAVMPNKTMSQTPPSSLGFNLSALTTKGPHLAVAVAARQSH
jgi:hypothetical protein